MRLNLRLGSKRLATEDDLFARVVRFVAEAVVMVNEDYLEKNPETPELYRAGVRYQNEPQSEFGLPDEANDIPAIRARGWGDCLHLTCWRVAELRRKGQRANVAVIWSRRPSDNARIFHVLVRLPNGSYEDPSKTLGMTTWQPPSFS